MSWCEEVSSWLLLDRADVFSIPRPPTEETLKLKPSSAVDTSHIQINLHGPSQASSPKKTQEEEESLEKDILPELDLMPPPKEIVTLLKKAERKDVTATVYVRCLHAYQDLAQEQETSEAHSK